MKEAIDWLEDNGTVAIYCEAIDALPEPVEPRPVHRKKRGFRVHCGSGSMYVTAILVAVIQGACKNLGEDMKCRIYERRPLVCRIYPAEINPFIALDPANKVCPPEAWPTVEPQKDPYAAHLPFLAETSRQTDYQEALRKGMVCAELGINTTALADEGYVRYLPEPCSFVRALKKAFVAQSESAPTNWQWRLYSPSRAKTESAGGLRVIGEAADGVEYKFLRA